MGIKLLSLYLVQPNHIKVCMLGDFSCLCCRLLIFFFFKINVFKKLFQEHSECGRVWIQIRTNILSVLITNKRKIDEKICYLLTAPELETKRSEPEARPHSTEEQEEDEEPAQESQPLLREVTIVTTTTTILPTEEEGESEEEKKEEEEDEQDEYADEQNEEVGQ